MALISIRAQGRRQTTASRATSSTLMAAALALGLAGLAGCGQTGPLYLPETAEAAEPGKGVEASQEKGQAEDSL